MPRRLALVVEDEPANARLLSLLVERCGLRAEVARDGREGLEMVRAHRPDLVLLDLNLPVMRGEEVLATMRADPDLRDVPVIVVTTMDYPSDDAAPGVPYIRKPYSPAEVQQVICEILGGEGGDV